ncbi:divergent polysaccharide deacetylase family protein [Thermanaerovibrio acidaminovorans]|uniref:divergent polysaccharide deacetylase family protein n=1 Tax=Thermanaerovibrio acidaminovorans TaxID=81462 RepID=UPI0024921396|nr:divergent polysaccharide deacetylase family protein [Thermanaerovibrio acidaminovorans]
MRLSRWGLWALVLVALGVGLWSMGIASRSPMPGPLEKMVSADLTGEEPPAEAPGTPPEAPPSGEGRVEGTPKGDEPQGHPKAGLKRPPVERPALPGGRGRPWLAIVVDDMGYDLSAARRLAALRIPMTWAIIPGAPRASQVAEIARAHGIPYLVHLPMQALSDPDGGESVIHVGMDAKDMRARVRRAFDSLPGAVGVNNHRGSAATSDSKTMGDFMKVLAELRPGWFFLDSATSPRSVARKEALRRGIRSLRNGYFIDSVPGREDRALAAAVKGALKSGGAVAIGHPRPGTLEALSRLAAGRAELPVRLVALPEAMGDSGGGEAR